MILFFLLLCAFLIGIGFIFAWIDFRTKLGMQFHYYVFMLLMLSVLELWDIGSYWPGLNPRTCLWLQKGLHLTALVGMVGTIYFVQRILGHRAFWPTCISILICMGLTILIFVPGYIYWNGKNPSGGILYDVTFFPAAITVSTYTIWALIYDAIKATGNQKKRLLFILVPLLFIIVGGILDLVAMVFPATKFFPSCKSIGLIVYGSFCAYFFVQEFFTMWRERENLFQRLVLLSADLDRLKPLGKLGENTSIISHEIKNFVSILRSNNLLLQSKLKEAGNWQEMDRMTRSTDRLEQFTRSILDFSTSADSAVMEPLDLTEVARRAAENHFPDRLAAIEMQGESSLVVLGNKTRLEQVFLNLLKNGFEAGADRIRIRLHSDRDKVSVCIEDNGKGCTHEEKEKLGSPFFSTKKDQGGTGLGLSIVASIMQNHGGSMEVTNHANPETGKCGLTFHLIFPAEKWKL